MNFIADMAWKGRDILWDNKGRGRDPWKVDMKERIQSVGRIIAPIQKFPKNFA